MDFKGFYFISNTNEFYMLARLYLIVILHKKKTQDVSFSEHIYIII